MFWHEYWWSLLIGIIVLPLVSLVAFGLWLRGRPNLNLEVGTKCWDAFIKLISAFTIIVSGAMLFGKYIDQQEQLQATKIEQMDREFALREAEFLRQQLIFDTERHQRQRALLTEAKNLAARIASMENPEPSSLTRFEELYFADLIGVEKLSGEVEAAMVQFRRKLKGPPGAVEKGLYDLSLDLSRAVELELKESQEGILKQHRRISELLKLKSERESGITNR